MKTAEKIMKKKTAIKAEMDKILPKAKSDALWREATVKLDGFLTRYSSLPKGVHMHTDSRILPSAAIYLTVKDVVGQDEAYRIIEDAAVHSEFPHRSPRLLILDLKDLFGIFCAGRVSPALIPEVSKDRVFILCRDHCANVGVGQEMCLKNSYSCYRIGIIPI